MALSQAKLLFCFLNYLVEPLYYPTCPSMPLLNQSEMVWEKHLMYFDGRTKNGDGSVFTPTVTLDRSEMLSMVLFGHLA